MLVIVTDSPYSSHSFDEYVKYAVQGSDILLIQDAVYGILQKKGPCKKLINAGLSCYVLLDDLLARGLTTDLPDGFKLIDMAGFVELTEKNQTLITW